MESYILILGIFSWFVTGVDDVLIFAWIWEKAISNSQKCLAVIGFIAGVSCMIAITILFSEIVSYIKYTNIILGAFLIFVGINTSLQKSSEIEFKPRNICLLSFLGYLLNCSDDIVWNTSMIAGKSLIEELFFFVGLFIGVLVTIFIVRLYSDKLKNYFKLRGLLMIVIGFAILLKLF